MTRSRFIAAAALALALACKLEPGGRCQGDADCQPGLRCGSDGLCVVETGKDLGASCAVNDDCVAWGTCERNICVLAPGKCVASGDCVPWEECSADHVCVPTAGECGADADCQDWQVCRSTLCTPAAGRCDPTTATKDCQTWQKCDAQHSCVSADCTVDADCVAPNHCTGQKCQPTFKQSGVALWGTLIPASATGTAVAALDAPDKPLAVFPAGAIAANGAYLGPSGDVFYVDAAATTDLVRELVGDALGWDAGSWAYPLAPESNDVAPALYACPTAVDLTATSWIMKGGSTGALYRSCGGADWYDGSGVVSLTLAAGSKLLAWDENDVRLVLDGAGALHVVDATGVDTPATGLTLATSATVDAWRTKSGGGFWLAVGDGAGGEALWTVDATAAATSPGSYPALPAGTTGRLGFALDSTGALFELGKLAGRPVVAKRTVAPQAAAIVYQDSGAVSGSATTTKWYVGATGARLVSGP